MLLKITIFSTLLIAAYAHPTLRKQWTDDFRTCGYQGCPAVDPLSINVHLVPHTHDDVGWLKTLNQYYTGNFPLTQKAGVNYIIDSVVFELLRDPAKKFIYVESAFFHLWWNDQEDDMKEKVKMLVNEGRLEFIGGAWSMNDEATVHYQSVIDQFTYGLKFLNDTFGKCSRPRVAWQIDPFGHSREQASLFAQMGYDGLFFSRLDYQDKGNRLKSKTPEMIWKASPNLGEQSDLFTGVLYNHYSAPSGFCFDFLCSGRDDPFVDDPESPDYNVDTKVKSFLKFIDTMSKNYRSNNLIITMGDDFNYQSANMNYKNMDKLIKYIKERKQDESSINIFYSTPSCYLKSLHDANMTWPTKTDDFFPYSSDPHAFWTGYYSSRPTLKRFERVGNHFLQVCKQLSANAPVREKTFEGRLNFLRDAMGVMQHHDAVTGTEKQHVAEDYARLLNIAIDKCGENTKSALTQLSTGQRPPNVKDEKLEFTSCLNLNISSCDISEKKKQFVVTVYNALAHSTQQYIRVPVSKTNHVVKDYRNITIPSELVPIPDSVIAIPHRKSDAIYELVFLASELPPLGYKSYFISEGETINTPPKMESNPKEQTEIGNDHISVVFETNGFISHVIADKVSHVLTHNFMLYEGAEGNNEVFENRSSGAYIFRPKPGVDARIIARSVDIKVFKGKLVDEVHQIFNEWVSQVVRIYKTENHVEMEWMVGPIPIEDKIGKEITSRIFTSLNNNQQFYTDSNGREMLKRKWSHRETWKLDLQEEIAGNYYPINTKISLEDSETRLSFLTDRAQGGTVIPNQQGGQVELMVHRRLLRDDAFGVGEALNETAFGKGLIARGKHFLVVGKKGLPSPNLIAQERFLQNEVLISPWLFFSDASDLTYNNWMSTYNNIFEGIQLALPKNIYLMTLEPWNEDSILARFEHILEKNEDPEWSKPARFNFEDVFRTFDIDSIREVTLAANQWLDEADARFKFRSDGDRTKEKFISMSENIDDNWISTVDLEVVLNPMQIRTFIIQLNPSV